MKNNEGRGVGLVNFLPVKRGGGGLLVEWGLLERVGLIEDVCCAILYISFPLLGLRQRLFLIT